MKHVSKRQFLKHLGYGGLTATVPSLFGLPRLSFANDASAGVVVVVFLRGGCDGLNTLVPIEGDDRIIYETHRPRSQITNAIPIIEPGAGTARFGMHPALSPLQALVDANDAEYPGYDLTFFPATHTGVDIVNGIFGSFSHFSGQEIIEYGGSRNDLKALKEKIFAVNSTIKNPGLIARLLQDKPVSDDSIYAFGNNQNIFFQGDQNIPVMSNLASGFGYSDDVRSRLKYSDEQQKLSEQYCQLLDVDLCESGALQNALSLETELSAFNRVDRLIQANGNNQHHSGLAGRFRDAANLIQSIDELQFITIDDGGYDHHVGLVNILDSKLGTLASAMREFHDTLKTAGLTKPVEVVVITEFGRTVDENGSENVGTDHGQAFTAMVMGAGGSPKKQSNISYGTHQQWPGLEALVNESNGRYYLNQITDYRDILSEVMIKRAGLLNAWQVFNDVDSSYSATYREGLRNFL